MSTVLMSVRLSPELASKVDRAAEHLECSPSRLVEALLAMAEAPRERIAQEAPEGPFTERRNFRLRPETMSLLGPLAGEAVEASGFIRQMLAYFLSTREWSQLFAEHHGTDESEATPEAASPPSRSRAKERHVRGQLQGSPLALGMLLLALLLPLLITGVQWLLEWERRRRTTGTPPTPGDGQGELFPPSSL
jgi:predicted transcriptional regulator